MAMGPNTRGTMLSEINVTPLVDVMLVLLIIFMLTAPMAQKGVKVSVPEASAQPMGKKKETALVKITKTGAVHFDKKKVAQLDLRSAVVSPKNVAALENVRIAAKSHKKMQKNKEAHIEGHYRLAYGWVVNVMVKLQQAKVTKLGLVTRRPGVE